MLASEYSEIGYRSGPWEHDLEEIEAYYFNGGTFLVGLIDNKIIAIGGYRKIDNKIGHIRRMRVHPEYRRQGFAQQILTELENEAIRNGIEELRLRTSIDQEMAQRFYEKNGYTEMKSKKEFYTEGGGNMFEVIWYRKILLSSH